MKIICDYKISSDKMYNVQANISINMKITNNIRRQVMKITHVRMRVDRQLFGEVKGDFAYYLRGRGYR